MKLRRQAGVRMKVIWKAACAAALTAASMFQLGCGDVYRPIATPAPTTTANPAGAETEVALNQCPAGLVCVNNNGLSSGSVLTTIDVSGDSNSGNKPLGNVVGSAVGPASTAAAQFTTASPMAFDYNRTNVYTANNPIINTTTTPPTRTDTISQLALNTTSGSFAANVTTIALESGSNPIGISFQYYGTTYKQTYVVNSGTTTTSCSGTGSLGVITQATGTLAATVCVGPTPVFAWIYKDQSKVFVLDSNGTVYVVNATSYQVTNTITVGTSPTKAAQSNTGQYIYVINSGNGTNGSASISVIDGQAEQVVARTEPGTGTFFPASDFPNCGCSAPIIDIAQDPNFNDTTANSQVNRIWMLHSDGTVSVWNSTVPGQLTWVTSIQTITPAQATAMPPAYPTNLALMRDGSFAYVGIGNTDQVVAIDTTKLVNGGVTPGVIATTGIPATTSITVGVHRAIAESGQSCDPSTGAGCLEVTTPAVSNIAVSRGGNSPDLSKAYAATTTTTYYYYYDGNGNQTTPSGAVPAVTATPAWCSQLSSGAVRCLNLYNGTAIVAAANNGSIPVNSYITTVPAPAAVTYCQPTSSNFDSQKDCPAMVPTMVLGRS